MVLLKNTDNTLPLSLSSNLKIAIVGPHLQSTIDLLSGPGYAGKPTSPLTWLDVDVSAVAFYVLLVLSLKHRSEQDYLGQYNRGGDAAPSRSLKRTYQHCRNRGWVQYQNRLSQREPQLCGLGSSQS